MVSDDESYHSDPPDTSPYYVGEGLSGAVGALIGKKGTSLTKLDINDIAKFSSFNVIGMQTQSSPPYDPTDWVFAELVFGGGLTSLTELKLSGSVLSTDAIFAATKLPALKLLHVTSMLNGLACVMWR